VRDHQGSIRHTLGRLTVEDVLLAGTVCVVVIPWYDVHLPGREKGMWRKRKCHEHD